MERILKFDDYISSKKDLQVKLNSCDTLRLGLASYTFACMFADDDDWEELVDTDRYITGKLNPHFKGDTSIEIEWDIDLRTGVIKGWDCGEVEIYFKVTDMAEYALMCNGEVVAKIDSGRTYVPLFLQIEDDECFDDYISIKIDERGHINKWNGNTKRQVIAFFKRWTPSGIADSIWR